MLSIHLRDIAPDVVAAWEDSFSGLSSVKISCGDIFQHAANAIVSPANSFGFMDGGIDLVYSRFFGWELDANLKAFLAAKHFGELPVGQAVIIPTNHEAIPFLVSAPTMRVPSNINNTVNVYLAFRASLIAVLEHNQTSERAIESLLIPGFGTGIGAVSPEKAARQMRFAYDAVVGEMGNKRRSARDVLAQHHQLLSST